MCISLFAPIAFTAAAAAVIDLIPGVVNLPAAFLTAITAM